MAVFGYARVCTDGQSLASQDAQLRAAGCAKVYAEKVSGAKTDRAELAKVLRRLDAGDVLMVTRLDRLARSTRDLLNILDSRQGGRRLQIARRCLGRHHHTAWPADADCARRSGRVRARADPRPYKRRQNPCEGQGRAVWPAARPLPTRQAQADICSQLCCVAIHGISTGPEHSPFRRRRR